MAEIYRNSYVTIAAASSKDSKGGLGLDRPRRSGTTLRGTTSSGKLYSIHVQCGIHPHMRIDEETPEGILHPIQPSMEHDYAGVFGVFPLLTRGWVFQERLLSPRFLQFGKDELLWDCRESMLCECGQRPPDLPYDQVTITSQNYGLISHKWRKIVEFYCSLSLTVPEDKLPALSGLARQVQELKPDVPYLAGLWGDSLDLDLLWIPYGPENQITNKYIAPSWSWASVGRKIIYPNVWRWNEEQPSIKTLDTYFESIEATCTPSAYDPTGKVRGGRLVLKSVLSTISVYNLTGDGSATEFRHNNTSFSLSTGREPSSLSSNWRLPFEETRKRAFLDHPGTYDRFIDKGSLYSCRLARVEISEDSIYTLVTEAREIIHVEFSLLLERINEGSNLFKRIGLLADGRFIEGHRGDPESWSKEPSCFESGAKGTTLTIV
ncbi:hypothetical protein NUW58_g6864 [Xylaria curta]|uniref:Uncharacterized protein n=1 Tax=Xylaria curta TaxID=42375 RepID=A0ACC1NQZ3_9PEZI|nr:hypothetical protein NUW58_g6864 [Xylaria curta]